MSERYIYCGQIGDGSSDNPFRPEVIDEFPIGTSWAANQEILTGLPPTPQPSFVVHAGVDDATFISLVYDPNTNPLGFDWLEVQDDGTVVVHAA